MADFTIRGKIDPRDREFQPEEGQLQALALDRNGQVLGKAEVAKDGTFEIEPRLREPTDVRVVIAPAQTGEDQRHSSPVMLELSKDAWKKQQNKFTLKPTLTLDREGITFLLGRTICISGHVRKIEHEENGTSYCPVPFVKVEIFDVDREPCWWQPILKKLPDLLDRPVVKIPDLLDPRPLPEPKRLPEPIPEPFPIPRPRPQPDPAPLRGLDVAPGRLVDMDRLADARLSDDTLAGLRRSVRFEPQAIGEVSQLDPEVRARLDKLTLTSIQAPWVAWPHCFYSKRLICTTQTNEHGYFNCCFKWWPIHFRQGRLRFDWQPDVIVRVTQVIDGVEQVIYLDPYTNTRWNVEHAHIDLFLDDERIECGTPDDQERPEGTQAFFTRIGRHDEVYKINQSSGLYQYGGISNAAYGHVLNISGQFGDSLADGTHYYRLSWRKKSGGVFQRIKTGLQDVRVNKMTNLSQSHVLGPHTVNGESALYEIRDAQNYLWYNPDFLASWNTLAAVEGDPDLEETFVLRLEVFDQNGQKLGQAQVDYLDGTHPPNGVLPSTGQDWADLVIHVDNKAPDVTLDPQGVVDPDCGVIPWSPNLVIPLKVDVVQINGRLHDWGMTWQKGVTGGSGSIQGATPPASANGQPSSVHVTLPARKTNGDSVTKGLTGTCAFTFHLWAYSHVRNGNGWLASVLRGTQTASIAVEKCS